MSDAHHDDWFQHSAEEGAAQEAHGQINAPFIIGFLSMVIIITFALVFIILGYVGREVAAEKGDKSEDRTDIIAREVLESKTRWRSELEGDPRWINLETRTVRIPLDYAAQEVVSIYQQNDQN
jgi:hypothetical protein